MSALCGEPCCPWMRLWAVGCRDHMDCGVREPLIPILSLLYACCVVLEEGLYLSENQSPYLVMKMLIVDRGCKDYIC